MGAQPELLELLKRPMAEVAEDVRAQIEAGPIEPGLALPADRLSELLEAESGFAETGWCSLSDGGAYTAVRTVMPQVTGEMLDWWFDWHALDPLRYRIWYPGAHFSNHVDQPRRPGGKPYWGAVHHPVEDVGLGTQHLRIAFSDPTDFGFPADALARADVATIICGRVGDDRKHAWHTRICHVARNLQDGVELRSRFWIGSVLGLYGGGPPARLIDRLIAQPAIKRRLIPAGAPQAMARHCAAEYANLASLLPELHARYSER